MAFVFSVRASAIDGRCVAHSIARALTRYVSARTTATRLAYGLSEDREGRVGAQRSGIRAVNVAWIRRSETARAPKLTRACAVAKRVEHASHRCTARSGPSGASTSDVTHLVSL